MSESKKACNFFKDMRCVSVNPARRVLPSMPARRHGESRFGRFGNPPPILALRDPL
jgi:hypothetical protein